MKIFGNKKQHQLAKKVVENYLLGKHALDLAESDGSLSVKDWAERIDQLISNTIDLLSALVGTRELEYYIDRYCLRINNR